MQDRALALMLRRKGGARTDALLGRLAPQRWDAVSAMLAGEGDAEAEICTLRAEELATLDGRAAALYGAAWRDFAPALRFWVYQQVAAAGIATDGG